MRKKEAWFGIVGRILNGLHVARNFHVQTPLFLWMPFQPRSFSPSFKMASAKSSAITGVIYPSPPREGTFCSRGAHEPNGDEET